MAETDVICFSLLRILDALWFQAWLAGIGVTCCCTCCCCCVEVPHVDAWVLLANFGLQTISVKVAIYRAVGWDRCSLLLLLDVPPYQP